MLLSSAALAQVDPRPLTDGVSVSVSTSDLCMTAEPLITRIVHWRRHDQLDGRISVRVLDRSGVLAFDILFQGRVVAERTFDRLPRECATRRDAVALAVSLALDHVVQRREEIAAEFAVLPPPAPTTVNPSDAAPSANAPTTAEFTPDSAAGAGDSDDRLQLGFAVGAALLVHGLPGLSALGEVAIELSRGWIMGRLGVLASTSTSASLIDGEVSTRLVGGRADLCVVHPVSTLAVIGCGGMQAGAVHMTGKGFAESSTSVQPWVSGSARAMLEWPRGTLRMRLVVEGVIPLLSPSAQVVAPDGATLGKLTTVRGGVILGLSGIATFQ